VGVAGIAGVLASPENVNFLVKECRGILYVGITRERLDTLGIGQQSGSDSLRSQIFIAVDAIKDVTTGVSASDRMRTIQTLIDPHSVKADLRSPGHVLPTLIDESGDVAKFYFNEALQYLVTMAGLMGGVALAGVLDRNGSMATAHDTREIAANHGIPVIDIHDVLRMSRWLDGWDSPWSGWKALHLVHLRIELAVRAYRAHETHENYPVAVFNWCIPGQSLRIPCACRFRFDQAVEALEKGGLGAVALWRPLDRKGEAMDQSGCDTHTEVLANLDQLIAADLSGGEAVPFSTSLPTAAEYEAAPGIR
jgi:3,4-dihydroxy-2-butanone 4-phosphate synthase